MRHIELCLGIALLAVGLALGFAPSAVQADDSAAGGQALRTELETGLRVTKDDEKAFIQTVVQKVDTGELPLSLVKSTFVWARRKSAVYPYVYFEKGLRLRAASQGISL